MPASKAHLAAVAHDLILIQGKQIRELEATNTALLDAAKSVVANRGCGDPDCCALARANDAAVKLLEAAIATAEDRSARQ